MPGCCDSKGWTEFQQLIELAGAAGDSVAAAIYGMAGIWPLQPPFAAAKQALMPLPPTEETTADERANIWVVIRTQARCKDP